MYKKSTLFSLFLALSFLFTPCVYAETVSNANSNINSREVSSCNGQQELETFLGSF